jgi:hypothetical protein
MKKDDSALVLVLIGAGILFAVGGGAVLMSGVPDIVQRFAQAIANQEGYNVSGSLPNRYNNPGDLTKDITGTGTGVGDQGLIIYGTAEDGWNALYAQVQMMFDGTSSHYNPSMTITQVAQVYAADWFPWARNVASYLGVSPDTPLNQLT